MGSPHNGPKQYRLLGKEAIINHTLRCFISQPTISKIILVIHPDDQILCQNSLGDLIKYVTIVQGGETRQASTLNGLIALEEFKPQYVHIHDGARPFVSIDLINNIHAAMNNTSGVIPTLAVSDTLKRVNSNNQVTETVARQGLYAAQTPQTFPFSLILNAHKKAYLEHQTLFTDDSALAEWFGIPIQIVNGSVDNIKITWPEDIDYANLRLSKGSQMFPDIRTGNGYDVHSFEEGDHVTLCNVKIPYNKKLNGHSDADVALHALTDALLATRGAGDIGTHFPPSDPQWKGASSDIFVRHAVNIVKQAGGRIINADITLIAEDPKIGPHRSAMTQRLMDMLGICADRISIKATTNEKMGFVGRKEGIAAIATANVIYPGEVPS